jgi:cell division protein FtsI (penicillin-binding protein 3)
MTMSYGHGISTSPVHLAAAYAAMVNGGTMVTPTLLRRDPGLGPLPQGERVISRPSARGCGSPAVGRDRRHGQLRRRRGLRGRRQDGLRRDAAHAGRRLLRRPQYQHLRRVFPSDAPRYVLVTTLYEPAELSGPEPRRTAGWTTVPVSAELIRRAAPLLGLQAGR